MSIESYFMTKTSEIPLFQGESNQERSQVVDILELIRQRYWLNAATYSPDPDDPNKFYEWPY